MSDHSQMVVPTSFTRFRNQPKWGLPSLENQFEQHSWTTSTTDRVFQITALIGTVQSVEHFFSIHMKFTHTHIHIHKYVWYNQRLISELLVGFRQNFEANEKPTRLVANTLLGAHCDVWWFAINFQTTQFQHSSQSNDCSHLRKKRESSLSYVSC